MPDNSLLGNSVIMNSSRIMILDRMYDQNIPEQMIKEVTGHKSDCVRYYKRTSDQIRETASHTISGSGVSIEPLTSTSTIDVKSSVQDCLIDPAIHSLMKEMVEVVVNEVGPLKCKSADVGSPGTLSLCQMIHNVAKTRIELAKQKKMNLQRKVECPLRAIGKIGNFSIDVNLNINVNK